MIASQPDCSSPFCRLISKLGGITKSLATVSGLAIGLSYIPLPNDIPCKSNAAQGLSHTLQHIKNFQDLIPSALWDYSNLLTPKHFNSGRHLTADEIKLAKDVFKDKIPYNDIKVYEGFPSFKKNTVMAITVGNDIYYTPESYKENFVDLDDLSNHFGHELEHVEQYNNSSFTKTITDLLIRAVDFCRIKDNYSDSVKPFKELNYEQQAIV